MQRVFVAFLACCFAGAVAAQPAPAPSAEAQTAALGRGVNILGYDPVWKDRAKARFKTAHFARIKAGGFQSVRINLPAFNHMDSQDRLAPDWLATLDGAIDEALRADLNVVIDEHDFTECAEDAGACRRRLLAFWEQVATHTASRDARLVFEPLNEPNGAIDAPTWNALAAEILAVIRRSNPTRNVVIGPADWNNMGRLADLRLPEEDRHIIVAVHYYSPMEFTHQGASWSDEHKNRSGVTWGTDVERAALERDFDAIADWSKRERRPILIGEFGAYDAGDLASRVAWTSAVARAAERRGFAFAYWQFDVNFIVFDIDKDAWFEPIRRALVPDQTTK